ncbi:MAG TPA: ankyrin repeat domain-containing protein [Planctomycetota bacterium]|nr:ankyrin repeat domain-containing protein [Planctomycetota bacterium]
MKLFQLASLILLSAALCSAGEAPPKDPAAAEPAPVTEKDPAAPTPVDEVDDGIAPPPPDIFAATKGGNLEYVKKFIEADPALVNARTRLKDTPLHWAVSCDHNEIVKYLISKGAAVSEKNISGKTPLHLATGRSRKELMKILLEAKCDVNATADGEDEEASGETPLHIAAHRCKIDILELLLEYKADVNIKTKGGVTAIEIAKKRDRTDLVKLLARHGGKLAPDEE